MSISVVTIVRGRLQHLRNQRRGLAEQLTAFDEHVVVRMGGPAIDEALEPVPCRTRVMALDDASPLPLARARNSGAAVAAGSQLVFLDVDCIPSPGMITAYSGVAERDGLWTGPVWYLPPLPTGRRLDHAALRAAGRRHSAQPYASPGTHTALEPDLFWSLNFAVRHDVFDDLGGFDERYVGYGGEDTDFAATADANGIPINLLADAHAFHQHHPTTSPPVQHLDAIVANARVFHRKWGRWPMRGWLDAFAERELITLTADTVELR